MHDLTKPNNLIPVDKTEIRKHWHLVKPGLEFMHEHCRLDKGCLPEDVFGMLLSGNATLLFTSIARNPSMRYATAEDAIADSSGFIVVQKLTGFSEAALHIWIAVSNETTNKGDAGSIMRTFNDELNEIAKATACASITFGSNQAWWKKIAPNFDFEMVEVKWRRPVK